ncbi:MAG: DNA polymerase I [Candidatus Magasanikbacteria bacterium RIFCSPHIGHO2_02_FULL_51_14]|uniref:DNA polymerase I n=1 Tax=Candidatus Magasanikbacteria bacterium RIFCSPHIGHO2_02_FULL_51_14 TaxID=1798683 RepID=A0A1F6MNW9_9BACT|nr:MAG: DNA polymerase I [Candidatus Magasanikbacteria bacterium RIFCSPHIGHO2_02_FULL_51_14]
MVQQKQRFVIIDGNAIIHRAYHALPPLTAKDGTIVNAVYGFTSMLLKVINELKPTHLAVSFDVAGPTFRDEMYKEYKATRVKADQELYDQIPLVHQVVEAFDIPIYIKEGFEADDVIGTIAQKIQDTRNKIQKDSETVLVTGDKDMLQLVDNNTKVYLLRKGISEYEMFDVSGVKKLFGFGPEHVVDYKALHGDPSDNIPGVHGIGDKTAKELIAKIGGVDEIYRQVKSQKSKVQSQIKESILKKLQDGKEAAKLSKELATIRRDVDGLKFDLKACEAHTFNAEKITELLRKFEFYSLVKRIPGVDAGEKKQETSLRPELRPRGNKKQISAESKVTTVTSGKDLDALLSDIKIAKLFACKEMLSGANVIDGELVGFVFVVGGESFVVELKKLGEKDRERIFEIFTNEELTIVGHDLKQLVKALQWNNGTMKQCRLFDIMIASYLINSSTRAHDLPSIVLRELGKELPQASEQTSLFGDGSAASSTRGLEVIANELQMILEVYGKYVKELERLDNRGLFDKVEMPLIPVLAEMELNGVAVDAVLLSQLSKDAAKAIDRVSKKIWKSAGEEFNISSSLQLRVILFDKMKLPVAGVKKGKTGLSTAASELEKLRGVHPIIELIEEYREVEKLRNTYTDVLPTLVNKKTGRIHTTFNQAVTTTGRLSSSDPNLQNIPIRTELGKEIRNAFIAEKGFALVGADYSQIELRIVASMAEDKKMLEIFKKGEDIHQATAAVINDVPLEEVTKEMRRDAKAVNFGVLYGMGSYGLASRTGMSNEEAQEFIQKYFSEFSGVKTFMDGVLARAKKDGYVETLFGRRRYIPELASGNFQLRSAAERMAINMPIQGTAADLMKMAMIQTKYKIHGIWDKNDVKMILQVHDELVLEVKKGLEEDVSKMVKETMENVVKLRVPIEAHVSVGERWGELK